MHTDVSSVIFSSLEKTRLLKDHLFTDFMWMSYSQLDCQSFVKGSLFKHESKGKISSEAKRGGQEVSCWKSLREQLKWMLFEWDHGAPTVISA